APRLSSQRVLRALERFGSELRLGSELHRASGCPAVPGLLLLVIKTTPAGYQQQQLQQAAAYKKSASFASLRASSPAPLPMSPQAQKSSTGRHCTCDSETDGSQQPQQDRQQPAAAHRSFAAGRSRSMEGRPLSQMVEAESLQQQQAETDEPDEEDVPVDRRTLDRLLGGFEIRTAEDQRPKPRRVGSLRMQPTGSGSAVEGGCN
uniref:LEM domain-containing protein n=1 Tax=Macrostomum lignano TaxID=282301 RepID=A0A1I8FQR0_9PLAT